jgi:hypothetical protein
MKESNMLNKKDRSGRGGQEIRERIERMEGKNTGERKVRNKLKDRRR